MKVLFIMAPAGGGNLTALHCMLKQFDKNRILPVVLCYHQNKYTASLEEIAGVKVHYLPHTGLLKPLKVPATPFRFLNILLLQLAIARHYFIDEVPLVRYTRRLMAAEQPDLVQHYTDIMTNRAAVRAARQAGVPQLMYNHSLAGYGSKYLAHFLDRRLMKSLSFHFHMSAAICAHFNRLFRIQPERNMVLHAITDRDVFRPSSPSASLRKALSIGEDDFVVSSIGRITEWKGQHVLIEAIHLGGVQLANCRILIAGPFDDGIGSRGYMDSLRALSKRYGLEKNIQFLGNRDDIEAIINISSVIVHSAVKPEPQGLVILEALLCGKPVVASDAAGSAELVKKYGGILFEPGNAAMLAGVLRAMQTGGQGMPNGAATVPFDRDRLLTDFNPGRQAEAILEVYQNVIAEKHV